MRKSIRKISVLLISYIFILGIVNSQDITTGLVLHYEFENTSGDVIDGAGSHNGTNYGANRGVTGKIGNAFNFDGSAYVVVNSHSDISNYSEFTLAAWIYPTSSGVTQNIIAKVTTGRDFVMQLNSASKLNTHFYDGGFRHCYSTSLFQTNQWIHVLCTWKNNQWKVYYNGALESTCDHTGYSPPWISNNMYIGSISTTSEKFHGKIDEVRIYSRALTDTDVSALYNSTGGSSTPYLSLNDISVNEGDGTATFTISMTQTSSQTVSGNYYTNSVSAIAGSDFTGISSQPFTISPGNQSTTANVSITDDSSVEGVETFELKLESNPQNASINDGTGICTISDNDAGLNCTNTVSTFPYSEGFENSSNTWENRTGDDIDWTRMSGSTPSGSTGPDAAQEGDYYNYIEASSPNFPNKTAVLYGPCFVLSGQSDVQLSFYYHMYGSNMGTLSLEASTDGSNWTSLWSMSGNIVNLWNEANVSLNSYIGNTVQLRFYGTTGSGYTSDMAIDNVTITTSGGGGSSFWAQNGNDIYPINTGNVGIGTTSPDEKLTVDGIVHAKEVIIDLDIPAPDYVFGQNYRLEPISKLEKFLEQNNHLPEFPPASEMETEGVILSRMNMSLLKRIEELTLYIIEQEKRILEIEKQYNFKNK